MITSASSTSCLRLARTFAVLVGLATVAGPAEAAPVSSNASDGASVTCRPVLVRSTVGGRIATNSQLAPIRNGKVLVVDVAAGRTRMVAFRRGAGRWLVSTNGARYAVANQGLSRGGRPGTAYVIASRWSSHGSIPCAGTSDLRARASDAGSVAADGALPASGYTETALATTNAGGRSLRNAAPLEVCGKNPTHPDGATLTRRPAADVWCYRGPGGYLNDPSGIERTPDGEIRHFINHLGGTVAAAKRPNVKPDGTAILNSPIAWRIVAPRVQTTNGFGF